VGRLPERKLVRIGILVIRRGWKGSVGIVMDLRRLLVKVECKLIRLHDVRDDDENSKSLLLLSVGVFLFGRVTSPKMVARKMEQHNKNLIVVANMQII
jgi:hypothetical protein